MENENQPAHDILKFPNPPKVQGLCDAAEARTQLKVPANPIHTGLADLDRVVGGFLPGTFNVVGALPQNGKTTFLLNWMNRLYDEGKHKIAYMGTETDAATLYILWAAFRLGYEERHVLARDWDALPPDAQKKLDKEIEALGWTGDQVWIVDCPMPNLPDIRATIDMAVSDGLDADVIIFDHLHRIVPFNNQTEREALRDVCRLFATSAIEHQVAVVAASQLKREDGDRVFAPYRPPYISSFLGSSAIEHEATVGLGLYRPLKRMTLKEEREIRNGADLTPWIMPNTMAAKVVKHRRNNRAMDKTVMLRCVGSRIDGVVPEPGYLQDDPREDGRLF